MEVASRDDAGLARASRYGGWSAYCEAARALSDIRPSNSNPDRQQIEGSRSDARRDCR